MNKVRANTAAKNDKWSAKRSRSRHVRDEKSIVDILFDVSQDSNSEKTSNIDAPIIRIEELAHCMISTRSHLFSSKGRNVGL